MSSYLDVVLNNEDMELPAELVENEEIFKAVLSYQTWENLPQNDKAYLKTFLPSFSVNSSKLEDDTIRLVFSEDRNFKHGNPLDTLYRKIKAGCCSPTIVKQLKKCRRLKYKDYKLKEKQRYRNLLQEVLISRQRILDQLARHGPGQPIQSNRSDSSMTGHSFDEKIRKKYQKIIKEVKTECQDDRLSSDEEDDCQVYEHVSLPFRLHENHIGNRYPVQPGLLRGFPPSAPGHRYDQSPRKSPAAQSLDIGNQGYRDMLESHRKRRICNEAHPELDVSSISLADIIMRANPTKKVNKKSKKVKKVKKCRDEKMKMKKKHRPALPPLTSQDVFRIKQESARKMIFEKEEIISEEKIEEHLETSSANDEDEDVQCFFSLLRGYFLEKPDMARSETEVMENVAVWEHSNSANLASWSKEQPEWSCLVTSALHFLAGKVNPLPDFVPLVNYIEETNEWKWTGIGNDDERFMVPLFNIWLESLKQIEASNEATIEEPEMQLQNIEQQKTDFVVRPSTEHEKAVFQLQERKRYENPHKPFIYRMHGFTSTVGPVKGVFNKDTGSSKAREHALLVSNRPAYVTILSLVRDAVARLPNGEGTRAEVCQLLKDSLFINPEASDAQIHAVVSGALDRLHAEKDPCVKYDTTRKLWVYLHRVRSVQEFERIHQASAAAAMAKKQLNQKLKTSTKKRPPPESYDVADENMKNKGKTSKKTNEKPRKSSKRAKLSSPSQSERFSSQEQNDITSSPSSSPMQSSFHSDYLLPKEELVEQAGQFGQYFTQAPTTRPDPRLSNSSALKITLPRGGMGSLPPEAMTLQMPKSSNHRGMIDVDHEITTEQSETSEHLMIGHDSSEFLPRMDASFDDAF